ncbi:MAG: TVP38/TMEM64 family protein [Verrucomicrobia bacterium]|nr:TVP38/TMEM64 family protein [Verrucomicrobiota bacterium]MBV9129273.1 TVP38/TMEM64 family protein [Verrucomicrobiota bacterium]MBV9645095.1 TVP38/TMEM64 family protein [Verrucomicrobiota bacterium]
MTSLTKKLVVAGVIMVGLAITSNFFPVIPALQHLCTWVGSLGPLGVLLLALFLAIGSLFFFPASPFIIAGSAVFGFPLGVVGAITGLVLGAAGGFCLSRWFLRKEVSAQFRKHATFRAIDIAIEKEGWKIVILLRLCPIPFGLANYLYGLTGVRFRPYLIASLLGGLPSLLLFCQLGSAGKAGLDALASGHLGRSTGEVVVLGIGMVATICAIVLIPLFARKAVQKYTQVSLPSTPT